MIKFVCLSLFIKMMVIFFLKSYKAMFQLLLGANNNLARTTKNFSLIPSARYFSIFFFQIIFSIVTFVRIDL
jgi:hypothetical protein